jgi:hypothetical protein
MMSLLKMLLLKVLSDKWSMLEAYRYGRYVARGGSLSEDTG